VLRMLISLSPVFSVPDGTVDWWRMEFRPQSVTLVLIVIRSHAAGQH